MRSAKLLLSGAALAWSMSACGGASTTPDTPTPQAEPEPEPDVPDTALEEPMDSGKDCVTAMVLCEGGVCTAKIQNSCDVPVTCELNVLVMCASETDTGEARAKGRDTFAAGATAELQAGGNCEGRGVRGTIPETLNCS